ncbi:MAG: phage holin family protein [Micrococcus sp.]|nr:phage holin family protein [Micrococcus sp.]
MIKLVMSIVVNAVALWVAAWLLPGMDVTAAPALRPFDADWANTALAFALLGLLFGAVNAIIRPIVAFLSLPITCLTLGLFAIVINAGMLALTAWLSSFLPVQLYLADFFWTTILAGIVVSLVSLLLNAVTGPSRSHGARQTARSRG